MFPPSAGAVAMHIGMYLLVLFCAPAAAAEADLEAAMVYAESLKGAPYGWWAGGNIPATGVSLRAPAAVGQAMMWWPGVAGPAWASNEPAPPAATVVATSCFCAGVLNLMLRKVGDSSCSLSSRLRNP
jgi:hypothetical protein